MYGQVPGTFLFNKNEIQNLTKMDSVMGPTSEPCGKPWGKCVPWTFSNIGPRIEVLPCKTIVMLGIKKALELSCGVHQTNRMTFICFKIIHDHNLHLLGYFEFLWLLKTNTQNTRITSQFFLCHYTKCTDLPSFEYPSAHPEKPNKT